MDTERIDKLLHMFNEVAPIARTFGMRLSYDDEAQAIVDLPYNPGLDHALGGIHGGIYATLLDTAGWFTAAAAHDDPVGWRRPKCRSTFGAGRAHSPARCRAADQAGQAPDGGRNAHLRCKGRLVGHATGTFIALPNVPFA